MRHPLDAAAGCLKPAARESPCGHKTFRPRPAMYPGAVVGRPAELPDPEKTFLPGPMMLRVRGRPQSPPEVADPAGLAAPSSFAGGVFN